MQSNIEKIASMLVDKEERVRAAAITAAHNIVSHHMVIPIQVYQIAHYITNKLTLC